jgi:hypothetical protein
MARMRTKNDTMTRFSHTRIVHVGFRSSPDSDRATQSTIETGIDRPQATSRRHA